MNITAQKWGNSLAIRLPKNITSSAKISAGTSISIHLDPQGNIQLKPVSRQKKLEKYLEQINEKNLHNEISSEELNTESW